MALDQLKTSQPKIISNQNRDIKLLLLIQTNVPKANRNWKKLMNLKSQLIFLMITETALQTTKTEKAQETKWKEAAWRI